MLKDKIVFITGASSGIGEACAKVMAREGAKLILCARRIDKINALSKELKKEFGTASFCFALDVRNQPDVAKAVESLPAEWRAIDILINNAGLSRGLAKLHEADLNDWEEMIDTNVKGLLYVSRAILPGMVKRKSGHVVNIGSVAGHQLYPGGNVYCATKHAVDAITQGMQIDLVDTPIRVSTVDPGMVDTEFSTVRFHGDEEKAKTVYTGLTPLAGEDIAETVLFCVTRPPHVNIHQVHIMPKAQAAATISHRKR
ncbi:MAG: SDR family oxidoreductase [candidate division Zixibacteria bacterium]|nr:SDR family oxidoreductase [candidate division Zixibacteria bacterium]